MTVLMPESLDEACAMLAEGIAKNGEAPTPIAGATDLFVEWPLHADAHSRSYLDMSGATELRAASIEDDAVHLGALTTYWDVVVNHPLVAEFPLLLEAARQVGSVQIQTRGTWAGNIANASPAADGVPVLMAYDATVVVQSEARGRRAIPLDQFYLGYKKTQLAPDELIVDISLPRGLRSVEIFEKVGTRRAQAIAKVGLAITHSEAGWRVVAASMAPVVTRCAHVEHMLEEQKIVKTPQDFLNAIEADVSPIDDVRSNARYRKTVMSRLLYHDLKARCAWIE